MNRFGRFAEQAWRTLAPTAYSQIPDPSAHFSRLGELAESQWAQLWPALLEPDVEGEEFFTKVGRVEAAKLQAEEMIRADLLTPPADDQEPEEGEGPGPLAEVMRAWRDLMESPDS